MVNHSLALVIHAKRDHSVLSVWVAIAKSPNDGEYNWAHIQPKIVHRLWRSVRYAVGMIVMKGCDKDQGSGQVPGVHPAGWLATGITNKPIVYWNRFFEIYFPMPTWFCLHQGRRRQHFYAGLLFWSELRSSRRYFPARSDDGILLASSAKSFSLGRLSCMTLACCQRECKFRQSSDALK